MKKLLLSTVLIGTIATANAQVKIGPEAGVNFASASIDDPTGLATVSPVIGFKAGVIADLALTDNLYLQPGVLFNMKGVKQSISFAGFTAEATQTTNYVEVPINFLWKFDGPGYGRFFVGAGPYIGMAISSNLDGSVVDPFTGQNVDTSYALNIGTSATDQVKPLDFGANVGIGYELPVGLFVRGQFSYGFANTVNTPGASQNNWVGSLSLGYLFGFD